MRARSFAFGCAASIALGASTFVGCVDIFHSTDFGEAAKGPIDFCSWSEPEAQSHAMKSCALLAACQSPVGENETGECIVHATFAYDCDANPNLPVAGNARAFWMCMAQASSCTDVASCVYSNPPSIDSKSSAPSCNAQATSAFTSCGNGGSAETRVDCQKPGAPAAGESCLAVGRECAAKPSGNEALCLGKEGATCTQSGCTGTALDFCVDAGGGDSFDRGLDCADYGAGTCIDVAPSSGDASVGYVGPTCAPVEAGTCASAEGIRCLGSVALSCPNGFELQANCGALASGVTCRADSTAPAWDVTSACATESPACASDACSSDKKTLIACVRGSTANVDCASLGLADCAVVTTSDGPRAACGPR